MDLCFFRLIEVNEVIKHSEHLFGHPPEGIDTADFAVEPTSCLF